jgi:hypothetical protein
MNPKFNGFINLMNFFKYPMEKDLKPTNELLEGQCLISLDFHTRFDLVFLVDCFKNYCVL